jgi:ABC-type oligopeptide transport system ATPase subunit
MARPLLEVEELLVAFPGRRRGLFQKAESIAAVDRVSFSVEKGEAFGIVGGSGSGKTVLLRTIAMLIPPTSGAVRFEGEDVIALGSRELKKYRRRVHLIFQNPYTAFHPRMTIGRALAEPLAIHGISTAAERRDRIDDALRKVGMDPAFVSRYPHQFSGGQLQRLGVARALVQGADLLLADEPVSSLDVSIQAQVLNLFQDLRRELGLTYIVIAHDLAVVRHLCDRVGVLLRGRFVELGSTDDLYVHPAHPYTEALLRSLPTIRRGVTGRGLPEVPIDIEERSVGRLTEIGPGHFAALSS